MKPNYKGLTVKTSSKQTKQWKKIKRRRACIKCGSLRNLTKHHVIPKVHLEYFAIKKDKGPLVCLCGKCHKELEDKILWTESFVTRCTLGDRVPLTSKDDYWYLLSMFIGTKRFSELLKNNYIINHCPKDI